MLTKDMMQEIQDLKLQGYTPGQIHTRFLEKGGKAPSMPTIRKYYHMDVVPDRPGANLEKPKAFDTEPFRSVIIEVLRSNEGNSSFTVSSLYDVLEEKFVEGGEYEALPRYIRAHLTSCGCQEEVFSPDAVSEVFRYSRGVPRMINRACMAGLTYATSRETRRVNGLEMKEIIDKELS